jgi:large subunit ribosomal protein L15
MKAHLLKPKFKAKAQIRRGRGSGSGKGAKSGRGSKGQKARAGFQLPRGFEGGQSKMVRRIPKRRGFHNKFKKEVFAINLSEIDKIFKEGETVSPKTLQEKGILRRKISVKILSDGELTKALKFENVLFSKKTKEKLGITN